jgi:hypothetical protein
MLHCFLFRYPSLWPISVDKLAMSDRYLIPFHPSIDDLRNVAFVMWLPSPWVSITNECVLLISRICLIRMAMSKLEQDELRCIDVYPCLGIGIFYQTRLIFTYCLHKCRQYLLCSNLSSQTNYMILIIRVDFVAGVCYRQYDRHCSCSDSSSSHLLSLL